MIQTVEQQQQMCAVWGFLHFMFSYAKCASEEGTQYEQQARQWAVEGSLLYIRRIRQEMQRPGDVMVTWTQSEVLTCICPTSYLCFITFSALLSHHKRIAPGFTWKQTKTWVFKWTHVCLFGPHQSSKQLSHHPKRTGLVVFLNRPIHKCDCTLSWRFCGSVSFPVM